MAEDRMLNDAILLGLIKANSGGGGGTNNYENLNNLPKINSVELKGNKSLSDLGIASAQSVSNITNGESINNFAGVETALATKQTASDNSLETDAKTIVGAINEHEGDIGSLKSGLTNLDNEVNGDATTYPYADVITINDAVPANLADCSVKVEPVQDLHGYDKPWVGGAGKNKLPLVLADIKTLNSAGTWSGNAYTIDNVTFTILVDNADNVTGISINASSPASADIRFDLCEASNNSECILNGCPSGGSQNSYRMTYYGVATDSGSGADIPANSSGIVYIRIASGYTPNNVVFYPMIRLSTETDATFAPYTNICPITGHTEASVKRDGKNLCYAQKVNNTNIAKVKKGYTYTFSCDIKSGTTVAVNWLKNNPSGDLLGTGVPFTFTADEDFDLFINGSGVSGGTFVDSTSNYQLELGSSATTYEPYQGKTYTIALGDTIYGGTVRIDRNGNTVMDVDRGYRTFTSSDVWEFGTAIDNKYDIFRLSSSIAKNSSSIKSDSFEGVVKFGYKSYQMYVTDAGKPAISVPINEYNITTLHNLVDNTNFVYELATPFTVQLTPQQIQLLQGTNTLTASTGQISVTVNGVSGSIGAVQEQVNELAEEVEEIKPLNYSTTEQKTGQKWIDDKDIYAITVSLDNAISMNQGAWGVTPLSAANIDTITSIVAKSGKFVFSSVGGAIADGYVNLMNNSGNSLSVDNFTVWYTKSTT